MGAGKAKPCVCGRWTAPPTLFFSFNAYVLDDSAPLARSTVVRFECPLCHRLVSTHAVSAPNIESPKS